MTTEIHPSIATRPDQTVGGAETAPPEPAGGPDPAATAVASTDAGVEEVVTPAGRRQRSAHSLRREVPVAKLAGLAMIGVGALIALFVLYLFAFTPLTASRNQHRLAQSLVAQPLAVYSLVDGHVPAQGSAVAVLQIPVLHLRQVVVEGTSAADLMNGPGLMPGSAIPGGFGNTVIAGRRTTFGGPFGQLGTLRPGEKIHVFDGAGSFTYRVSSVRTVTTGQRDVVLPTLANRITLVTSNSSLAASGRLAVVGTLVGQPSALAKDRIALPKGELGLDGDPVAGWLAALWSLLTLVVLVGTGWAAWRWRRPWLVYLFAAPVIIACGLFACESVARALPATF